MVAAAVRRGPRGGRVMGNMREFNRDSLAFVERCAREFGDVVPTRFLYVPALFLFHPDQIEYVLAAGSKNFIKPASLRSPFFHRLVGKGLVTSEGEFWRRQCRLAQPAFHRDRVDAYGRVMVDFAERMLARWRGGQALDAHEGMMVLTQAVVARTRLCIGNYFATMEAVLILATVARRFRLRLVPGQTVGLLPAMSLRPKAGVMMKLEERRRPQSPA